MPPLPSPNLDDRTFDQLMAEAKARIALRAPGWTDLSPHDPGIVLLELFAHLTEVLIYRHNRVPEKVYVELLNLIGVQLLPPTAARVDLVFLLAKVSADAVLIPRGTAVTASRAGAGQPPVVFLTTQDAQIDAGALQTDRAVPALHCERVEDEVLGAGTGQPGLVLTTKRKPIIARTSSDFDLRLGVEADPGKLDDRTPKFRLGDRTFRIWREVEQFADLGDDPHVYLVDRASGRIVFAPAAQTRDAAGLLGDAPAALAAVPPANAQILVSYSVGGGDAGNVAAHMLDKLRASIPGVSVDNPAAAAGGRGGETLENALKRGPSELYSLRRAVTARDYEVLAERAGAVSRARAFTKAAVWTYARPGTVEVALVPRVPDDQRGEADSALTLARIQAYQTEPARAEVQKTLDDCSTIGTECNVTWAHCKPVAVSAQILAQPGEDTEALRKRIIDRLYQRISPLRSTRHPTGWNFGHGLGADTVYGILLSEPGLAAIDWVKLTVEDMPGAVPSLAVDTFQKGTFYAVSGAKIFRSTNSGRGWEPVGVFPGENIVRVRANPNHPGLLAIATTLEGGGGKSSRLHLSWDCGESWSPRFEQIKATINDFAWIQRDGQPALMIVSDDGLRAMAVRPDDEPTTASRQIIVDGQNRNLGFVAVAATVTPTGTSTVIVSGADRGGVYMSIEGGAEATFRPELKDEDVGVLEIQTVGSQTFVWAGTRTTGKDVGHGCFRRQIVDSWKTMQPWQPVAKGWQGESVRSLAFQGTRVVAGSFSKGVLWADSGSADPVWNPPDLKSGLQQRGAEELFQAIRALATDGQVIMAGSDEGIVRSSDGKTYEQVSKAEVGEGRKITIPHNWLFCSAKHEITVVKRDAAPTD
jgi:hypothetical protein